MEKRPCREGAVHKPPRPLRKAGQAKGKARQGTQGFVPKTKQGRREKVRDLFASLGIEYLPMCCVCRYVYMYGVCTSHGACALPNYLLA